MSFKKFLELMEGSKLPQKETDGTYVSVQFTDETNKKLEEFTRQLGLEPVEKFHSTVVYSVDPLGIEFGSNDITGTGKITGIEYLGDKDSEWRAVVLNIDCPFIQSRHDFYKEEYGYVHSYPEFVQHISLAYSPPENIDLSSIELPTFDIKLDKEIVESLKV